MKQPRLTRRAAVRGASALALGAASLPTLSGCAAIAGVRPFLALLGEKATEGFALTVGAQAADGLAGLAQEALGLVVDALDGDPQATLYGYAPDLDTEPPWAMFVAGSRDSTEDDFEGAVAVKLSDTVMSMPATLALGFFYYTADLFQAQSKGLSETKAAKAARYLRLRRQCDVEVWELSDGDYKVTQPSTVDAVTAAGRNLRVEWNPSTERTEQSSLTVREGLWLKDHDPEWDVVWTWGIPSHRLWDLAE